VKKIDEKQKILVERPSCIHTVLQDVGRAAKHFFSDYKTTDIFSPNQENTDVT
jgi:hypothetical protein